MDLRHFHTLNFPSLILSFYK